MENRISAIIPSFDLLNPTAAFFFVFDFAKMQYLFVSESVKAVTGYSSHEWIKSGIDWVIRILDQQDASRLIKLHTALFDFYYSVPVCDRPHYKYAYDLRLVRKDGSVIWLLQQGSFIELCADGKPAITFDILTDITQFKKDNTMSLTMSKNDKISCILTFPIEDRVQFSKRELEILKLIGHDYSSKQIAETLHISAHTVDTHRRNMLKKAKKRNSTELIIYAKEHGLLDLKVQ